MGGSQEEVETEAKHGFPTLLQEMLLELILCDLVVGKVIFGPKKRERNSRIQPTKVQVSPCPLSRCVNSGKLLGLSAPQFLDLSEAR